MIAKSPLHRISGVLMAVVALALPVGAQEVISESRNILARLVETKKLVAKERNEWETEKEIMTDTINTMEGQIREIEESLRQLEETTTVDEQRRTELQTRLDNLNEIIGGLQPVISRYEAEVRRLIPYLPEPLLNRIDRLVGQLPRSGEDASRRLLNNRAVVVIGILEEMNNFNNSITVHPQLLQLPGRDPVEFDVIYYGLTTAFFVDETETIAGVGVPARDGWVWEVRPGIARDVFDAVQIRERRMLARFVNLPFEIRNLDILE